MRNTVQLFCVAILALLLHGCAQAGPIPVEPSPAPVVQALPVPPSPPPVVPEALKTAMRQQYAAVEQREIVAVQSPALDAAAISRLRVLDRDARQAVRKLEVAHPAHPQAPALLRRAREAVSALNDYLRGLP